MIKRTMYLCVIANAISLICVYAAANKTPARPNAANVENTQIDIKIMSYNLHHCNPPSKPGVIDIDAIVNAISKENPDLVALQEVDVNVARSGKIDQAKMIAEKLNMHYFFGKAIDHEGGDYGVAILSRFPISKTKVHRLPTKESTNGELRVLATALITLPNGQRIKFGSTHLDALREETNRVLQTNQLNKIARKEKLPLIIAGDLNAKPGSNVINIVDQEYKRTCEDCPFTVPNIKPRAAIDFIAFSKNSPFSVKSYEVIQETYASDHLPITAILTLKKK